MGQYFLLIDLDARSLLRGLGKFGEAIWEDDNATMRQLWYGDGPCAGHRILAVGDYATSFPRHVLSKEEQDTLIENGCTLYEEACYWTRDPVDYGKSHPVWRYSTFCILRNLDRKEYVDLTGAEKAQRTVLLCLVAWSNDPSIAMRNSTYYHGRWAGNCIDLAPRGFYGNGWTNITSEILPKIFHSAIDDGFHLPKSHFPRPEADYAEATDFGDEEGKDDADRLQEVTVSCPRNSTETGDRQWRMLPMEVSRLFIGLLERNDLGSIYSTNREFYHAATPFLFSRFTLDTAHDMQGRCEALLRGRRLELVRSCRLLIDRLMETGSQGLDVLQGMKNLRSLTVFEDFNEKHADATLLGLCREPWQLRSFFANCSVPSQFVASQQSLERLVLPGIDCTFSSPDEPVQYIRGEPFEFTRHGTTAEDVLRFAFQASFQNVQHLCISEPLFIRLDKHVVDLTSVRTLEVIFSVSFEFIRKTHLDILLRFPNVERVLMSVDRNGFGFTALYHRHPLWRTSFEKLVNPPFVHPQLKRIVFRGWYGWQEVVWDSTEKVWRVEYDSEEDPEEDSEEDAEENVVRECSWVPYIPLHLRTKTGGPL